MARSSSTTKNSDNGDASSDHANVSLQDLFDDGIYGKGYVPPPVRVSPESSRVSSPFQRPPSYKKVPSLRRKTESKDNLLENDDSNGDDDHDYDDVIVNVPALNMTQQESSDRHTGAEGARVSTPGGDATPISVPAAPSPRSGQSCAREYRDDEIYCNLPYTKEGGTGNTGQRWETYWKTQTLLRSPDQGQRSPTAAKTNY
jgi:hypothetical protein